MRKAVVVGLAGGSASGKTELSFKFEKSLNEFKVKLFHMDDYFKSEVLRPHSQAPITKKNISRQKSP